MIVRNERLNLGTALESVRGLADETVVVDTGSTDGTQDLAREMGACLVEAPWTGDFSAARNVGLDRARGDWILVLDADETLSPVACDEVRTLLQPSPWAAFALIQVGLDPYGRPMRMPITRLFPNDPGIRFEFPLHEQVDRALVQRGIPIRTTTIEIRHSGYDSPARAAEKRIHYRQIIGAALAKGPGEEAALHLWYLRAVNHYENSEWREAAEAFATCIAKAPNATSNVVRFSRIRAAECLLQVGDWRAASAYLPENPGPDVHPAALYFRARIATVQGDPDGARPWYEAILSTVPGPWQPEVNLTLLKQRAATALAPVPPSS